MKKINLLLMAMFLLTSIFFFSCKDDDSAEPAKPKITFNNGEGFTNQNTSAAYGDTIKIGVNVNYNGSDNLVKFKMYANNDLQLDSTINSNTFALNILIVKGTAPKEVWKFEVVDKKNNTISDSISITGNFGPIKTFNSVTLGAQDNTVLPSFLSLNTGDTIRYKGTQAAANQANVDIFLFYENTSKAVNNMTFAGPASGISGIFPSAIDPANYTTKNFTRFSETNLTVANFDAITDDALILASFTAPAGKYKKVNLLTAGKVVAFQLHTGKFGLIKILNVTPSPDGSATGNLSFDIKIQN